MLNLLLFAVAAAAGANAPQQPVRPPNGTYTYEFSSNGATVFTSTVVVAGTGRTFTVTEAAKLSDTKEAVVKTTYSSATLLPVTYELHQKAAGSNTDITATINASSMKFEGVPLSFDALPGTKYIVFGEGLNAYRVMMPWTLLANADGRFTFAAFGYPPRLGSVVPATATRPGTVALTDNAVAFEIAKDTLTAWYDPKTGITDEVDATDGRSSTRLIKYDPALTVLRAPSRVSHLPLPAARYGERAVSIQSDGAVLSATLAIPGKDRKYPAIIFVHGSGAGTREGGTQANPIFLQLGNALANSGVAVLRYDKRGIGKSTGTPTEDWRPLSRDVEAAVAFLRREPQIDPERVYILGHSEGGFIAPMIANATPVRGIVLMAGPAIPMEQTLAQQGVGTMNASMRKIFEKAFAAYAGYDPAETIKHVQRPILLLQGGKDSQVLSSDFQRLVRACAQTHRDATVVLLPEDDHLFIRLPESQRMQGTEIVEPHALDPRVPAAVLQWIQETGAKPVRHA